MVTRIVDRGLRIWMIAMLALLPLHPAGAQGEPPTEPRGQTQADAPIWVAAIFTVNSTADAVDANIGNGVCATAGSVCTLRAAVQEANFTAAADTINLPVGIFILSLTGVNEEAAATGDLDIDSDLTIIGVSGAATIIDGAGADRVFDIYNPADVTFRTLQIRNGRAASGGSFGNFGGGLITDSGITVTLQAVTVFSNTATSNGGGVHNFTSSTLIINDSYLSTNTTPANGGGIYNNGALSLVASGLVFNTAATGGGIHNAATLTMTTSYVEGNSASFGNGGGLNNAGTAAISNSEIAVNTASVNGGGVANLGGTLAMTNTTLSFNRASATGGGMSGNGPATLNNITVYSNTAPAGQGGGIWGLSGTFVRNSLVADNTGGNCNGALGSFGYNLDSGNACGFNATGDLPNTNPLLDPVLKPNGGGLAYTHALLPGSPAIDRGNNSTCPATDQRGVARVDGNLDGSVVCDIGAFEFELLRVFLPLILKSP